MEWLRRILSLASGDVSGPREELSEGKESRPGQQEFEQRLHALREEYGTGAPIKTWEELHIWERWFHDQDWRFQRLIEVEDWGGPRERRREYDRQSLYYGIVSKEAHRQRQLTRELRSLQEDRRYVENDIEEVRGALNPYSSTYNQELAYWKKRRPRLERELDELAHQESAGVRELSREEAELINELQLLRKAEAERSQG